MFGDEAVGVEALALSGEIEVGAAARLEPARQQAHHRAVVRKILDHPHHGDGVEAFRRLKGEEILVTHLGEQLLLHDPLFHIFLLKP